jgi:hypothetical protein
LAVPIKDRIEGQLSSMLIEPQEVKAIFATELGAEH